MPIYFLEQAFYYVVMDSAGKGKWIGIPIQSYVGKSNGTYNHQDYCTSCSLHLYKKAILEIYRVWGKYEEIHN
jgi:hypothetical protein